MRHACAILLLGLMGCRGPLALPMVERLDAEGQTQVDESWLNMLSPAERLDRSLLLDVVLANSLHERGVDRLSFVSEKDVWGGRVLMTVQYDRAQPAFDNFSITYTDARGRELRHERYTFDEVKHRANKLFEPADHPETQPAETPEAIEQQRRAEEEMAARLARQILIRAATRPAGEPLDEAEITGP